MSPLVDSFQDVKQECTDQDVLPVQGEFGHDSGGCLAIPVQNKCRNLAHRLNDANFASKSISTHASLKK